MTDNDNKQLFEKLKGEFGPYSPVRLENDEEYPVEYVTNIDELLDVCGQACQGKYALTRDDLEQIVCPTVANMSRLIELDEYYDLPLVNEFIDTFNTIRNGRWLFYDIKKFQCNRDLVMEAVKQHGCALQFAPMFQEDREIVMEAVKNNGYALKYSPMFQTDREIVMEAVKKDGYALKFASMFQEDREIVLEAVKFCGYVLKYAPMFHEDREIVMEAVKEFGYALKYAPMFQTDREIVMESQRNLKLTILPYM